MTGTIQIDAPIQFGVIIIMGKSSSLPYYLQIVANYSALYFRRGNYSGDDSPWQKIALSSV